MGKNTHTFIKELRSGKLKKASIALEQAIISKQNARKAQVKENLD